LKLKDLSKQAIKYFCQLAKESRRLDNSILKEPINTLLEKLGLLDGKYLKRAAVLLFHPAPESLVTGAYTKIGFFRTNADLLFQDEINGDLFTQAEKTLDLLFTKYLNANISYRGVQRIEKLPVPEAALREAVLNALIHKNYASGSPIQISVYPDKLMIWNSGSLPPDWTVEKLLDKHASEPYNPDIANTFFSAGLIEAWGRGIERILGACRDANVPDPLVRYETIGLWIEFPFSKSSINTFSKSENTSEALNNPTQEITQEITQETTREKILALIKDKPFITRRELAVKIGLTQDGVKYHLQKLKTLGIIKHIGPTKAGQWEILK